MSDNKKCESPFKTNNLVTKWLCATKHIRGTALIIFYDGKRNSGSELQDACSDSEGSIKMKKIKRIQISGVIA